jgi:hypothetical protein
MNFTKRVRGAEAALVAPPGLCCLIEKSGESLLKNPSLGYQPLAFPSSSKKMKFSPE